MRRRSEMARFRSTAAFVVAGRRYNKRMQMPLVAFRLVMCFGLVSIVQRCLQP
jgi:hypothetical protein